MYWIMIALAWMMSLATVRGENMWNCYYGEQDLQIKGCTALAQSGSETTTFRANIYNRRGVIWMTQGLYDKALADFSQAIVLDPNVAESYYNRGVVYRMTDRDDKAVADYTKAIALQPDFADAYNNRSSAYGKAGRQDEAIADASKAIGLQSDFVEAYENRGAAYTRRGLLNRAMADFIQANRAQIRFRRRLQKSLVRL
jgi:tetratricopeptide (TPR) repeat protein